MRTPFVSWDLVHARDELDDAREALGYWEDRARRLPRHALRKRREAVTMAARWRDRVAAAERAHYGRGLLGTLLLVLSEGRLPESTRHGGRVVLRRSRQAALVVLGVVSVLAVLGVVLAVELLFSIAGALG
jgi:hypothetical protein